MFNNRGLSIFSIFAVILALVLGGVAIVTALRLSTQPSVSPLVPQAKPTAAVPEETPACRLSFTVSAPPALKCNAVTLNPSGASVVSGSETRQLTATASGGTAPLTYAWSLTGSGVDQGTLSSTVGNTVIWTAPGTVIQSESWTITATVKDATGATDSSGCVVVLSATPPTQACNSSCNSKTGCPSGLGCVSGQCRNVSCPTESSCLCSSVTPVCNSDCTDSSQCPSNLACSNGKCRNPSCTTQANCVCPSISQTHKECKNNACIVVNGTGTDTCTSDVSCRPAAVVPKIPPSGVELPTILGIVGGAGLLLLGFFVIL